MREIWVREARIAEVRGAARSWREAGAIDAATLHKIEAAYPDSRPRLAAAWRVLIFFLVSVAVNAVFFGVAMVGREAVTALAIVFGVLLAIATEVLRVTPLSGNGSDAASSFWAILYVLVGVALLGMETLRAQAESLITVVQALAVVLCAAACVHWGYAVYGGFAAAAFFLLLGRLPAGRLWWVLGGAVLTAIAQAHLDRAYPPPLRRAVGVVLAVSAAALYVAVNPYSLDHRWIEDLRSDYSPAGPGLEVLGVFAAAAAAIVPAVFLWWGIRSRRILLLDLGLVFAAASLVTLRFYVHLAPLWVILTLAGAALVLAALWVNRFLRQAPGGERGGFTAAPLYSSRRADTLQAAAVVAGFTGPSTPPRSGDLSTGGGRFGGGGASGEF